MIYIYIYIYILVKHAPIVFGKLHNTHTQEVTLGLGAMASVFHQKQQVVDLNMEINISKEIGGEVVYQSPIPILLLLLL